MEPRTLAFVAIAWLGAAAPAQDVASSNRRFVAHLRPMGDIEVVDLDQGREPGSSVLWKAKKLDLGAADVWRLTDDGKALVAIATKAVPDEPYVRIVREGRLQFALGAKELSIDPAISGGWLAPDLPNLLLREGRLDLLPRDGGVRSIDLVTGAVTLPLAEADPGSLRVEPAADPGAAVCSYVANWLAPEVVLAGEPLRVRLRGNLPTPAHALAGFTIERGPEGSGRILITPRMLEPLPGTVAPQVLEPFDWTANVFGIEPGEHRLEVAGQPARDLRVLPAGLTASLSISGGIAGRRSTVRLFADGRVETTSVVVLASDARRRAVDRALARIPNVPRRLSASRGANLLSYELVWMREGRPVLAERDDLNLEPPLRELVRALEKLALEPEAATRYAIDATKSFIEVHTGSGGLLSALGHDHKMMVRRLSGSVLADPADLASASVVLEMDAGSLAVVDDDSAKDRAEIEREMNEHVLEVSKHPTIRFDGRKVESTPTVDGAFDLVVSGELSLHGKLRRIRVPGRLTVREDSLRFVGRFALLQTDYGIEPTSAVGGTVKVADKVRIAFDVTAAR